MRQPDGKWRKNREFWSVLPGGFFGIRDQYDISRVAFGARCQKAVDMGVRFCVTIDREAHDYCVQSRGTRTRGAIRDRGVVAP